MRFFIYKITILTNNKIYIGQTINPKSRWRQHKCEAKKEFPCQIINRAMKKHGLKNCKFEIIACCKNREDAGFIEELSIKQFKSHISLKTGYNVSNGGPTAPKTLEWREKIRIKAKIRFASNPEYAKKLGEESKKYNTGKIGPLSNSYGRKVSEETKKKISEKNKNYKPTDEAKRKISEKLKLCYEEGRRIWTKEQRDKVRNKVSGQNNGMHGKTPPNKIKFTEEQINKINNLSFSSIELGKEFNVSPSVIQRRRKKLGLNKFKGNSIKWTDEQLEEIKKDMRPAKYVAAEHGVSEDTIQKLRKRLGIKVPKPKKGSAAINHLK